MIEINWLVLFLAGLIPLVTGFVWYNRKVFGTVWMVESGMTEEKAKGVNMAKVFIITYIMGFLIAFTVQFIVIHQYHYYSILAGEPGINDPSSPMGQQLAEFLKMYGDRFRSFKHGCLHGFLNGLLFVTPIFTINSIFERKSFKYIAINAGYWILTITLIGGVVCAFA